MTSLRSLADHRVTALSCPHCVGSHLHYSRLRVWERPLVRLTGLRPFRCRRCGWRGWRAEVSAREPHR